MKWNQKYAKATITPIEKPKKGGESQKGNDKKDEVINRIIIYESREVLLKNST